LEIVAVHDQLGVGEKLTAGFWVGQASGMVRMHVGQDHGIDVGRIDPGGL